MAIFHRTTVTFGEAKRRIAESTGSSANADALERAGRSLQAAFRHWNNAANWKWLQKSATLTYKPVIGNYANNNHVELYTTAIGKSEYATPWDMKAIHSIRMTSDQARSLEYIDHRTFNKAYPKRDISDRPQYYDLYTQYGRDEISATLSYTPVIRLFPTPSSVETFQIDYYRRMILPCTVTVSQCTISNTPTLTSGHADGFSDVQIGAEPYNNQHIPANSGAFVTHINSLGSIQLNAELTNETGTHTIQFGGDDKFLDCPEEYVEGILAMATHHYLINKAGAPRLEYWQVFAQQELERALRENMTETPDQEICFLPPYAYANPTLSPNDIRWADIWY